MSRCSDEKKTIAAKKPNEAVHASNMQWCAHGCAQSPTHTEATAASSPWRAAGHAAYAAPRPSGAHRSACCCACSWSDQKAGVAVGSGSGTAGDGAVQRMRAWCARGSRGAAWCGAAGWWSADAAAAMIASMDVRDELART